MTSSTSDIFNRHYRPGKLARSVGCSTSRDDELERAYATGQAITRKASQGPLPALMQRTSRFISRFKVEKRSPDQVASRKRKRVRGADGCMPPSHRDVYPESERAVMSVVCDQVKHDGYCDLSIDEIAAKAGVSRTTVQNAFRRARQDDTKHVEVEFRPRPGRKNMTNIIRIVSSEWVDWIKRSIGFKRLRPTKTRFEKPSLTERAVRNEMALEGGKEASAVLHRFDGAPSKHVSTGNGLDEPKRSRRERFRTSSAMAGGWV